MVRHPRLGRTRRLLGRAFSRRLARNTSLVLSWVVLVAIGSTASATALTSASGLGISHLIHDTRSYAMMGALFRGDVSQDNHFCSAGVVDSPGRDLIVTAAHCVSGGTDGLYFVPGYHDGQAPYGEWALGSARVDSRWTNSQDQDLDVAFVTVQPLNGRQIQQAVGGYPLAVNHSATSLVRITGYPSSSDTPITCANRISAYTSTQMRIDCTAYTGGTSGSPWVTKDSRVMGVIGGFQEGGNTPDVSYSPYFGNDVEALYRQAVAAS